MSPIEPALARALVLDELFDLALYQALRDVAPAGPLHSVLERMIPIERRHVKFWQDYFALPLTSLGARRRLELALLVGVCRLFGAPAIHLVLEAIEVYGVRKYLSIWDTAVGTPLEAGLRGILRDEFEHEDAVVTGDDERRINPERVRNIFLGLNDGLVEIVGAVSGFFGAFGDPATVLIAGTTTAVAGALSMAAGAFVASSSEVEVRDTELARRRFLGEAASAQEASASPLGSGALVGVSYFAGALVPMLPIAVGARSALPSVIGAGIVIIAVSMILAFLSGMNIRRRVLMNLAIIAGAAGLSYGIGVAAQRLFGIAA
jgi:VIT1/CCC1 family predicted Fe2+/Mn2+ transporter